MPTISQIASHAGVSRTSVWLTINHKEGVSDELRQRVMDAVNHLDSTNDGATIIAPRAVKSILLLHSPYITSTEYFRNLLRGIQMAVDEDRIQLRITASDPDENPEHISAVYFSDPALRPSGIISMSSELLDRVQDRARQLNIPCVEIGTPQGGDEISFVSGNEIAAGRMATRHLLELGHRSIGFIGHLVNAPSLDRRVEGYYQEMRAWGIEPRDEWLYLTPERNIKQIVAHGFAQKQSALTAVLFINWYSSVEGLSGLHEAGYAVPDDLSAIVFDDFEHAHQNQLTAVAYPLMQIGGEAVRVLVEHFNDPQLEITHRLFRTKLMKRASSAAYSSL